MYRGTCNIIHVSICIKVLVYEKRLFSPCQVKYNIKESVLKKTENIHSQTLFNLLPTLMFLVPTSTIFVHHLLLYFSLFYKELYIYTHVYVCVSVCTSECKWTTTEADIRLGVAVHVDVSLQVVKAAKLFPWKINAK